MDFKRHHQHQAYNFSSRLGSSSGSSSGHGFQSSGSFVGGHHSHAPHSSRSFKSNEGHNNGARFMNNMNMTHSFRNLLKIQGDMVLERSNGFQKLNQLRDVMLSRITNIANSLLKDEFFDDLVTELKQIVAEDMGSDDNGKSDDVTENEQLDENLEEKGPATEEEEKRSVKRSFSAALEDIKSRVKRKVQEALNVIKDETEIYTLREDNFMGSIFTKERRMEKDFLEFFNEAERQMMDYEKKLRSDTQMLQRLRSAEREIGIRDQKIMQLEDAVKLLSDRSEKCMAELQQVNADHQFEKLQMYHHVELCKMNAKFLALEELMRICKWKRCTCGRDYEEFFREFEGNYTTAYNASSQECLAIGRYKDGPDRRELHCTSSWVFPTGQSQVAPSNPPIPTGGFIPSEEAATKGAVFNDLRDRYDELQSKCAGIPNYDELRANIMKLVCHFKVGGLRVCEEMRGKQFASSLFYCNSEDLVPDKTNKIFSTGFGDTPEEATMQSVKRASDEIDRIENANGEDEGIEITFVRRNPFDSVPGKLEKDAIRMTLMRSYCNQKIDGNEEGSDDVRCLQEAHLYENHANAEEKYMADWKIHIRVEDVQESGIKDKLQRVLRILKDNHLNDFIDRRPQKMKMQ